MERIITPVKSMEQSVYIRFPVDAEISTQCQSITLAVANGMLAPGRGSSQLTSLGTLARIKEMNELEKRLKPKTECKSIANYAEWSDYCRQSLLWLGLPDPAACIFESMGEDPDRELLGEFLQAWFNRYANVPTSVKDATSLSFSNDELREIIGNIGGGRDGSIKRKRLGWRIKRHARQVVNGLRLVHDTSTHNAAKWKLEC